MYEIIIYHTNDFHGRLSTNDNDTKSIGIEKISKVVNLSSLKYNTLWLDAGDFIHGTPRMTNTPMEHITNMLNPTPLNALCTGNHDYNFSINYLYKLSKQLNAYILSANTLDKTTKFPVLLPYIIYSLDLKHNNYIDSTGNSNDSKSDDIKIGVFGLSTPETANKTNPKNVESVEFANPIEVAKNIVNILKNNCHIIIALTHLGLDNSSIYTSKQLAEEVEGIDLIVDGHSHTVLHEGLKINNTMIVQAGSHGQFLGKVIISYDNKIVDIKATLLDEQQIDNVVSSDTYIEKKLYDIDTETDKIMNTVVAHSEYALIGERELVRQQETKLGNLVADALRWKTHTDIAVINGGTLRTGLPQGDITFKDLISIFPFNNVVQTTYIQGYIIKQMLEHSIFAVPASFGGFLDVSGMKFSFKDHKIIDIIIDNQSIDLNKQYSLTTVDFILLGGDDYTMLTNLQVIKTYDYIEKIVAEYLNNVGINENIETGRIKIL